MRSIDWRSRGPAVRSVDPTSFFEEELPARLQKTGELACRGADRLGLEDLAIEVENLCWTLQLKHGSLSVIPGDSQLGTKAEMSLAAFSDLIDDFKSTLGVVIAGRARVTRGTTDAFVAWEPVLRAALDDRPVYEPGQISLLDLHGNSLDLKSRFHSDETANPETRHFLLEAGFVRIESVFTEQEMDAVARDLELALDDARPDDDSSWWVRTANGTHRPSRILDFIDKSETLRTLLADDRFKQLGQIPDLGHVHLDPFGEHQGKPVAEGLVKPLQVSEGISDLPWHKDCARGGHSRFCCGLTVGISLTGADRESGELSAVAGSHRANLPGSLLDLGRHEVDLPQVSLSTRKGDVTVHCSCTLHMARPPVARERMVVYTGFGLPPRPGDALHAPDEAAQKSERADISRQARESMLGRGARSDS